MSKPLGNLARSNPLPRYVAFVCPCVEKTLGIMNQASEQRGKGSDTNLTGLSSGTTVRARVTAQNETGESQPSTAKEAVVP